MFNHVLALSPHTDDAELGCGGTIAKLTEIGCKVTFFAFSWCDNKRLIDEVKNATEVLKVNNLEIFNFPRRNFPEKRQEILQILYDYDKKNNVDLVFTPATTDLHQDHATITQEAMRAFKKSSILGYEMPWNNIQFTTNCFIPLQEQHVQIKIKALECYHTEEKRHYFEEDYFRSILKTRGTQIREKYAEAFEVIKYVPKF